MTIRHSSKRRDEPEAPKLTVADYYRQKLTRVPADPTPASYEDYLRAAGRRLP